MAMGAGQHKAYKLDVVTKARVAWDSVDIGPSWPGTELDDWAGLGTELTQDWLFWPRSQI